jgi:hypothetical protein
MSSSIVLYAGLCLALAGTTSVIYPLRFLRIRTRGVGAAVCLVGLLFVAEALLIPPSEKRVVVRTTLLDDVMPVWQFDERHSIAVDASPERVYQAIREVRADEILLFQTLTTIRRLGRPGPESILNAPEKKPLLDVATSTTFLLLAEVRPRELVVGTVVAATQEARRTGGLSRDLFFRKLRPGVALAAMNFLVVGDGAHRSVVSTGTRVFANTPATARRFAVYWRLIHPGSDIIRRMWLRAVKRRAERQ